MLVASIGKLGCPDTEFLKPKVLVYGKSLTVLHRRNQQGVLKPKAIAYGKSLMVLYERIQQRLR